MKTVFLDAGHGGKDGGAGGHGLLEKNEALDFTLRIGRRLQQFDVRVAYSRTDDTFIPLQTRSSKSNSSRADVFVSIHLNAVANANAQGFEIFHYPTSNAGKELATNISNEIVANKLYTKNRGIKVAKYSVLGKLTKAPATLVEMGFITNLGDVSLMQSKRAEMVEAVVKGILKTIGVAYKPEKSTDKKPVIPVDANKPSDWAKDAWEFAIANGYTDGTRPKEITTREETMAMILKVTGVRK